MTILRCAIAAALIPFALNAQHLQHPLTAHSGDTPSTPREYVQSTVTVNVLAVMVQFKTDTDSRTTGTGAFDTSSVSGDIPIDAPPRNAEYFADHLTFLKNYYAKVSKGKVAINATLIPQVLTLPNFMSTYAPVKGGINAPVAYLARDAWRMVDSLGLVTSFSTYQAFVVFHAGAGHDIDLVSVLGYDPTDRDIPSLYLGPSAFQEALGVPYIALPGGARIANSIVMPETESRKVPGTTGEVLLEFGINGLLCASFGNYLGLPDLFNTATGATAIGRFGLMDGQGFFSFSGAFPPEPSAWEKYWLGWVDPINVGNGTQILTLPAVALADTIYRVPISPTEYFLVENRNRDPWRNGQTVTMKYNGVTSTLKVRRDTSGFNAYDVTLLAGDVLDVEDLDWSLPGGNDDTTFYDGGILIWHIDERVIADKIANNGVNADAAHRGVDLEEADGSQDIGQTYESLSAASGSESGTALDFWFLGSNSPVNKNEFSATTLPPSKSYDGGESHVTMKNFSARGPHMTVQVSVGDSAVAVLPGFPKYLHKALADPSLVVGQVTAGGRPAIVVSTVGDSIPDLQNGNAWSSGTSSWICAWTPDGMPAMAGGFRDGRIAQALPANGGFSPGPLLVDANADGAQDVLAGDNAVAHHYSMLAVRDMSADSLADQLFGISVAGRNICIPSASASRLMFGDETGHVHLYDFSGSLVGKSLVMADTGVAVTTLSGTLTSSVAGVATGMDHSVVFFSPAGAVLRRINLGHPISGPAAVSYFGKGGASERVAIATTDGLLYLIDPSTAGVCDGFPVTTGSALYRSPALGDLDGDGQRDIVVFSSKSICAYNSAGVALDGFPINVMTNDFLASPPILGDVDGDGSVDVVGVTYGGLVVAYNGHGKPVRGFPLVAGMGLQTAAVFTSADSVFLVVASSQSGSISGWMTGRTSGAAQSGKYPWPQYQHDPSHSGVDGSTIGNGIAISNEFFPKTRAYNWPNPAYSGTTQIRYYLNSDAKVHIKIFDLAGDLVTQFDGPGHGGFDNEVSWDVSGVQSGVYFAHLEANGASSNGSAVIKIAVVH
jgi:hypothetical protein